MYEQLNMALRRYGIPEIKNGNSIDQDPSH